MLRARLIFEEVGWLPSPSNFVIETSSAPLLSFQQLLRRDGNLVNLTFTNVPSRMTP